MDPNLQEIYRLEKENNRMLHAMRRNAFWGRVISILIYVVVFILAPLWVYNTYVAPVMQSMQNTLQHVQGTTAQAQVQINNWQTAWKQIEARFGFSSTTSH